ncbi:MAG: arginine--tRNA ligase [Christensenellaceae bacterium]|jgi:arginyl-tRNA synthetase|nr:arginine--tRNA ligase [Christensenellaceae bacterium]
MDIRDYIIKEANLNKISGFSAELLTVPPTSDMGDFCLPCFPFAKELKKAPFMIAEELKNKINTNGIIDRAEVVGGYLNFFVKREEVTKIILAEILKQDKNFGRNNIGEGKTVFLDFSSPNLAKYMHIGHLANTVIGESIKRILKFCGYKVVAINYLGDFGTPFGKMVAAYKLWGNKDDVDKRGVDAIQDLYIKISAEIEKDPSLADLSRNWFRRIEEGDPEALEIYNWFITLAKQEVNKIYDMLGVTFDDWSGEAKYSKLMEPVLKELEKNKLVTASEGAKIVDLQNYGLGVCMVQKSDGTSLYATRDLAAVEDRYKTYKFDKGIYITDVSQKLHFAQWFKVCELLKKTYAKGLVHISYGRFSLPEGKIASRKGKQAVVKDILDASIKRAKKIVQERGAEGIDIETVARQIGIGAVVFFPLKHEKNRDVVFDLESALSFDGETAPYMQYTYARCCSILKKAEEVLNKPIEQIMSGKIETKDINNTEAFELIKLINQFPAAVESALQSYEPSIISKLIISLSHAYNVYYNTNRIIEDGKVSIGRLMLTYATKKVLNTGLELLNIASIPKM